MDVVRVVHFNVVLVFVGSVFCHCPWVLNLGAGAAVSDTNFGADVDVTYTCLPDTLNLSDFVTFLCGSHFWILSLCLPANLTFF